MVQVTEILKLQAQIHKAQYELANAIEMAYQINMLGTYSGLFAISVSIAEEQRALDGVTVPVKDLSNT